jgi:hypothetical protein
MTLCLSASETRGSCSDCGRYTFLCNLTSYPSLHGVNPRWRLSYYFYIYIKDKRNFPNCVRISLYFHKVYLILGYFGSLWGEKLSFCPLCYDKMYIPLRLTTGWHSPEKNAQFRLLLISIYPNRSQVLVVVVLVVVVLVVVVLVWKKRTLLTLNLNTLQHARGGIDFNFIPQLFKITESFLEFSVSRLEYDFISINPFESYEGRIVE